MDWSRGGVGRLWTWHNKSEASSAELLAGATSRELEMARSGDFPNKGSQIGNGRFFLGSYLFLGSPLAALSYFFDQVPVAGFWGKVMDKNKSLSQLPLFLSDGVIHRWVSHARRRSRRAARPLRGLRLFRGRGRGLWRGVSGGIVFFLLLFFFLHLILWEGTLPPKVPWHLTEGPFQGTHTHA